MGKLKGLKYAPKLNKKSSRSYWLSQPGAPKPERKRETPMTEKYEDIIKRWTQAH